MNLEVRGAHRFQEFLERCEQRLTGLLQPLPIRLADVLTEEQIELGKFVVGQAFSRCDFIASSTRLQMYAADI